MTAPRTAPRQRAGWLTTKAEGKPVPFSLSPNRELECMECDAVSKDRDSFIEHKCRKAQAPKAGPAATAEKIDV